MRSETARNRAKQARNNIYQNPKLRLEEWRAALRSTRTPEWLRASIRKNIHKLQEALKKRDARRW
jgi:hypothetical protein